MDYCELAKNFPTSRVHIALFDDPGYRTETASMTIPETFSFASCWGKGMVGWGLESARALAACLDTYWSGEGMC